LSVLAGCLFALFAGMSGCSKTDGPKLDSKQRTGIQLHGKVRYNGTPLPYGYLKFAHMRDSFNPKIREYQTSSMATILPDGSYTAMNLPEGPVIVAVIADPDVGLPKPSTGKGNGALRGPARPPGPRGESSRIPDLPGNPAPRINPLVKDLNPEQIEMLKEVHRQFSNERTSGVMVVITPEKNQSHDFDLKPRTIITSPSPDK
jgi:hypothetical protein